MLWAKELSIFVSSMPLLVREKFVAVKFNLHIASQKFDLKSYYRLAKPYGCENAAKNSVSLIGSRRKAKQQAE